MSSRAKSDLGGVRVYVGEPRTGKTYRALADLVELVEHERARSAPRTVGAIVVDSTGASNFADKPHTPSAAHTVATAWHGGIAYFTPRDQAEFDALVSAELATPHGVPLLVDEVSYWRIGKGTPFDKLARTWRHHVPGLFVTTQRLTGDVTETLLACSPRLSLFRCKIPTEHHRKVRWIGIDPDTVAKLPDRVFEVHRL